MSNFSGISKSSKPFRPQQRGSAQAVFEKANQPVLDTDKTPDAGHRGERELGVSVDRIDRDGQAVYLASKISRVYRQLVANSDGLETLSTADRRQLADKLIEGVYDGDHQHPSGEAASRGQADTLQYIRQVAAVLFGLEPELPGTPTFLTRSDSGTLIKSAGTDITVFVPILHKDASKRLVYGIAAQEEPDKAGEVMDYASSKQHFEKWAAEAYERTSGAGLPASFGNLREQHSNRAVGKIVEINFDDANKSIPVTAHVVDDAAWQKVVSGVYTGFSIGGRYLNKWADGGLIRYEAQPAELSLVDSPCIPSAVITAVKNAPGNPELAALRKQLLTLTENIRAILARRAGVVTDSSGSSGRFVTKDAGSGNDPKRLLKHALDHGTPVPFSGADPRSEAERASGSGRKFQTRS